MILNRLNIIMNNGVNSLKRKFPVYNEILLHINSS